MRSIKNEGKTKRVRELQTLDHLLKVESKPRKKSGFPMYDVRQRPANRFGGIFGFSVIGKMRETHEFMGVPVSPSLMHTPLFIDLRNVYEPKKMQTAGFKYVGVGRG